MRSIEFFDNATVNCMLMTERSITDYEKDLDSLYVALSSNIEKEIIYIFKKYGKNDKVIYSDMRKSLNSDEYKKFINKLKLILDEFDINIITKELLDLAKKLSHRKRISILEYIQFMCEYYITALCVDNLDKTEKLFNDVYIGAFYTHYYNLTNCLQKDINVSEIDTDNIKKAKICRWNKKTQSERLNYSKQQLIDIINQVIPQCIARGFGIDAILERLASILYKRQLYDRTNIRTSADYINNLAHTDVLKDSDIIKYRYVAILDSRTTEECRALDSKIFELSQAVVGINLPPLHFNCRSSIAPYVNETYLEKLSSLDDISRKNKIIDWLNKKVDKNYDYIIPYIMKYF